jgi:hypothetical protein
MNRTTPKDREDTHGIGEIIEDASRPDVDSVQRQILRGDETKGDPDARDVAGAPDLSETPHGYEEIKTQLKEEAKENE